MRDGEPNMYMALATLRNGQAQRRWQRIQMMLAFDTIATPIMFSTVDIKTRITLSLVGFAIHVALIIAAMNGEQSVRLYSDKLAEIEQLDQEKSVTNDARPRVQVFSGAEYSYLDRSTRRVYVMFMSLGYGLVLAWGAASCYLVWKFWK
ncbi:hypothetical protein C4568_01975 [Candidatus Parcubacteria bacterium]|nr:MAG: hypothetical protein C4568_01975 [Candidatus Parcubacteria bacterium]